MSSETRKTKRNRNSDVFEKLANISLSHWLLIYFVPIPFENPPQFKLPNYLQSSRSTNVVNQPSGYYGLVYYIELVDSSVSQHSSFNRMKK